MAASLPITDLDPTVIAAAQRGDGQAHAAIYAHYANRIFTLVYRLIPRRALAEDLLHEVFVEVLRGVSNYTGAGSFGGWLRSIAINRCLMQLRSPWHRSVLWVDALHDNADTAEHLSIPSFDSAVDLQTDLDAALRQLTPVSRAVVWLHDVEGYTHAEIGELLSRTASFSKSQLTRAHLRLRAQLSDNTADIGEETLSCTPAPQSLSTNS